MFYLHLVDPLFHLKRLIRSLKDYFVFPKVLNYDKNTESALYEYGDSFILI